MFNKLRENFVLRLLYIVGGSAIGVFVAVSWNRDESIVIFGTAWQPEPLVFLLGVLGACAGGLISLVVKPSNTQQESKSAIPEKIQVKDRERLLKFVEETWITGFLDKTLNQMESLKLDLKLIEPVKVVQHWGIEDEVLRDNRTIFSVFKEVNRRLAILGESGAGKTVLMLQLAKELITEAKADPTKPIPIVLALSSWAANPMPLEQWLCKEIHQKYRGIPLKLAEDLVKGEQLVYLFDGLDEVAVKYRNDCLQAIKNFFEDPNRKADYALCSRLTEWQQLKTELEIRGEVIIQPLKPEQITYFLATGEFSGLLAVRENNALIQEFAYIPFMLNTMAVVTRGKMERSIRLDIANQTTPEKLRDYFLEEYVNIRLRERQDTRYLNLKQTRVRLRWLAQLLVKNNETDFFIEYLEPQWLKDSKRELGTKVIWTFAWFELVLWSAAGLVFAVVDGLTLDNLVNGLAWGLTIGLTLAMTSGFKMDTAVIFQSRPNEGFQRTFFNVIRVLFITLLAFMLIVGLAGVLTIGLGGNLTPDALVVWMIIVLLLGFANVLRIALRDIGGGALFSHILLRGYIAYQGFIPWWRYDHFLDYCADLVILRKIGGGYRFVHDYLRQYLASAKFVPDATHLPTSETQ